MEDEDIIKKQSLEKMLYFSDIANDFYSFKNEITYNNRFFPKHKIITKLKKELKNHQYILEKETILYRSRIYRLPIDINCFIENGYLSGYDAENSLAPKDKNIIGAGRANPEKISYLYLSQDIETSIKEIRPIIKNRISVARIKILKNLKLFDISNLNKKLKNIPELQSLNYAFSIPNFGDKTDYIPTQYIAELLKNKKFDGIRFNSSLDNGGINITLFNHENNCEFIDSKLYLLDDINIHYSDMEDFFKLFLSIYNKK